MKAKVYFAACWAAEKALPESSRALIERHDELHRAWGKAGWPAPTPPELVAASQAVAADELAAFAMDLRRRGNEAAAEEYRRETERKEAA